MKNKELIVKPIDKLKNILAAESVKDQFCNALAESAPLFIASLIDIYGSDKALQKCDPTSVTLEALKAAVLKLPLNKSLGFAWLIAYKIKGKQTPVFSIGYRGYVQMALRSGHYRYINADILYKGHEVQKDLLTGNCEITGEATSDKAIGYFAYLELLNGFCKSVFWTKAEVQAHAKRYSKSYTNSFSPWKSDFDQMAVKTVLTALLKKYGILSVEMVSALGSPDIDERTPEEQLQDDVKASANKQVIDIAPEPEAPAEPEPPKDEPAGKTIARSEDADDITDQEKAEIEAEEIKDSKGPGF